MRLRRLRLGSSHVPWAAAVAEKGRRSRWRKCGEEEEDGVRAIADGRNNAEAMAGLVENVRTDRRGAMADEEAEEEEEGKGVVNEEVMLSRWKAWRSIAAPGTLDCILKRLVSGPLDTH